MLRQIKSLGPRYPGSVARVAVMYFMTVVFSHQARAGDVAWHSNLRDAVSESAEQGRPMLILFTADWCGYCQKMRRNTLENEVVARRVKEGFVPVLVDVDEAPDLAKRLRIAGLPTVLIVSPDRKVTHRIAGYKTARDFDAELATALEPPEPVGRSTTRTSPKPVTQPRSAKPVPSQNRPRGP